MPRSNASSHLDTSMQFDQNSIYMEQHMAPPGHGHPYMSNDSILLQHYAEMSPMGDARSALQGDSHMHASVSFDTNQGPGGMALTHIFSEYTTHTCTVYCTHTVCRSTKY